MNFSGLIYVICSGPIKISEVDVNVQLDNINHYLISWVERMCIPVTWSPHQPVTDIESVNSSVRPNLHRGSNLHSYQEDLSLNQFYQCLLEWRNILFASNKMIVIHCQSKRNWTPNEIYFKSSSEKYKFHNTNWISIKFIAQYRLKYLFCFKQYKNLHYWIDY